MNALFYFAGYSFSRNAWDRFLITVPDGPHDRHAQAKDILAGNYRDLTRWSGQFVCLTAEDVFKEL